LATTFQILPTFQRETRATLTRLDAFQENTRPLIRLLGPVAEDLSPTLRSVRRLSPNLTRLFPDIDELIRASAIGSPALRSFLDGLAPVLKDLDPFLANLNPVIGWLDYHSATINDFLTAPPSGISGTLTPEPNQPAARHALRQLGYITQESLALYDERLPTNRGNGAPKPFPQFINNGETGQQGAFPDFNCDHVGGEVRRSNPRTGANFSPCYLASDFPDVGNNTMFPQVLKDGPAKSP
ncbi:MAG: hypothetical protein ACR2K6_04205, partial [Solirubrobacterales bacterium]